MVKIVEYDEYNKDIIISFISNVPKLSSIEDDVLKNTSIVLDNDDVVASLSFEKIGSTAFIRYFIFKHSISNKIITDLFFNIINKALNAGVVKMYSVADNEDVYSLFHGLGFNKVNSPYIYIEEKQINDNNSTYMYKLLC